MSTESTRRALIDATADVIGRVGVAGLTTKEVARTAGRSEGSIYNHFADKLAMVDAVLRTYVDELRASFEPLTPGEGDLADQLRTFMRSQIEARRRLLPVEAGLLADPGLRERQRDLLDDAHRGPQLGHRKLTEHLAAEQRLGRLPSDLDPQALAYAIIAACREGAHLDLILTPDQQPIPLPDLPTRIIAALLPAVSGGAT